ncbi:RNA-guided pseudouridylation complex pseudouridine synthase subunit Cbf5 [Candidatus Pacearchaeota archaeon]|nr:RNA-guided pseudouridylation complex pseudouridine synthase subunit Cbf5 [Candidatus Pacearchaeota archaeon]
MQIQKPISELLEFSIINVDKPAGLTSFKVCEKIRNIFNAKKAGHFGTLDPMVTGVLPVAFNRACRLSNYFMIKNKEYIGKMQIHSDISEEELKEEMEKFNGKIMQKPPVKSRVKRVLRERNVDKFKIIKKQGKIVEFESDVQAGTYIRKLISDLGERIGGAHMIELRRIKAGIFRENESHKIEEIEKAFKEWKAGREDKLRKMLIPAEIIKQIITSVQVKEEAVKELLNGKPLMKKEIASSEPSGSENSKLAVFNKERFIGIYKVIEDKDILARAEFVLN